MALFKVKAMQTTAVSRTGEGTEAIVKGLRDGTLTSAGWIQALILEGRCFQALEGAFSTPVAGGGAAAVIDADRPNLTIGVPDGVSIMPFRVHSQALTPLLATDADESEILLGVSVGVKITVVAGTAVTAYNLNTGSAIASACQCYATHSTNIATAPTLHMELARAICVGDMNGTPANALWGVLELLYQPFAVPVLKGPATLILYRGGTVATTGFTQACWAELPTSAFS